MQRILIALGVIAVLAAMVFLFSRREAPYSQAAPTYDERGPQQRAVIQLSDPQVYARETLLNDRLVESRYLADQLTQSATVPLKPQIKRELEAFEQLMVDLKGRTGSAAETNPQSEQAKHDRAERPDAGGAENKTEQTLEEKPAGNQDGHPSSSTARVAEDQRQAPTREGPSVSDGAPEEAYLDRQAFREKIRSDLAAVNLDDLHDFEGNALFRLQFRATVFPGQHKDKFGVVRVSINPPQLTSHDVRQLYLAWLAHATFRLNEVDENGQITANYLYRVLSGSGLYGIAYYPIGDGRFLSLAVNPQFTQDTTALIEEEEEQNWIESGQELLDGLQQIYNIARYGNLWGNA
jgi:hypothetical protein